MRFTTTQCDRNSNVLLRKKIFIPLVLALTIPVLLVGLYAYNVLVDETRAKFMQSIEDANTNVGTSINEILIEAADKLDLFATTMLLQNYITLDENRYDTHQPELYTQLLQHQISYPDYFLIQLILSGGQIDSAVDNRKLMQPIFSAREWSFFTEFTKLQPNETKYHVDLDPVSQRHIISFARALKYAGMSEDKTTENTLETRKTHYLSISMYANKITALLSKRLNLTNIPLVIVTQDNQIISHPSNQAFTTDDLQNANIRGIQTSTEVSINKQKYLLVPYRLKAGMTLYSIMPTNILSETAFTLLIRVILFLVLFIIIISLLCYFILNNFILKPISSMQELVADIAEGRMDTLPSTIDRKDELGFLSTALINMRQKIKSNQKSIQQLAFFDSLTKLPNRSTFQTQLDSAITFASSAQERFAVVFIDLDNFKKVNDTLGHEAGDELLLSASSRIKKTLNIPQYTLDNVNRKSNANILLARLGGDEFTMLIPVNKTEEAVRELLHRVVKALSSEFSIGGSTVNIGASIGVAFYPSNADNAKDLLKSADLAMYDAKQNGTNKVVFYYPQLQHTLINANNIESILRKTIENNDFSLDFTPRINLHDYSIAGFEIALCWQHPLLANISMPALHSQLQTNAQLQSFTLWMIKKALAKVKYWLSLGYKTCNVAINISSVQLALPGFVDDIKSALAEAELPSKHLRIEITISPTFTESGAVKTTLSEIHALGINITLNKFAQGLASFQQLRELPIDQIKLEQHFVKDAAQGDADLLQALINFTKGIGVNCVVEGVSTSTQHEALLLSGCAFAQGPYYAKLLSELDVDDFVSSFNDKHHSVGL